MYQEHESTESFRMPPNLYIIGTMNTADRSIALVDLALRRRFSFVEFDPHQEPINGVLDRWIRTKNSGKIEWLVERVARASYKLQNYGAASIGPSYFMRENLDDDDVERIWKHEVLPYVTEQFFGDSTKAAEFELDALDAGAKIGADRVGDAAKKVDDQESNASDAGNDGGD